MKFQSLQKRKILKLQKSIREDQVIAEDENEDQQVRDRARERIADKQRQIDALENEREELEERLPLRERVKNIFKKYGFTVSAVLLALGTTIGVIVNSLTKGLKSVATGIGNGLQTHGKKMAQFSQASSGLSSVSSSRPLDQCSASSERMPGFLSSESRFSWLKDFKRIGNLQ